ncbi:MAG: hypothetical protein JW863_03025 [Chitinispirillaceae bacterium]|nr:hypothetical protein [Chitinispirillaceae bacterium]
MKIYFILYTTAGTKDVAVTSLHRVARKIDVEPQEIETDTHSNGNLKVSFSIERPDCSWEETVVDVIKIAQRFGTGWRIEEVITGCIDLWSDAVAVAGIMSCRIYVGRSCVY